MRGRFAELRTLFPLLPAIVAIVAIQAWWLRGPLERDQSLYFQVAHQLINGKLLYTEVWDHKPPAIHLAYAASQIILGYGKASIWWLGSLLSIISATGLFFLLSHFKVRGFPLVSALLLWAVMSLSPNLEAMQPNTEAFINALWIWGAVFMISRDRSLCNLCMAAGCCGLATLFKPIAILLFLPFIFDFSSGSDRKIGRIGWTLSLFVAFSFLAWALAYGHFLVRDRGEDFYQAVVLYNRSYAGNLFENLATLVTPGNLLRAGLIGLYIPIAIALCGIALAILRRKETARAIQGLMFIGVAYITIALPGKLYLHYYQYLLPVLVIIFGITLTLVSQRMAWGLGILAISAMIATELPLALSPDRFSRAPEFPDSMSSQARRLAPTIKSLLAEGEWFYEWGAQPSLYFETGIEPRHGVYHASWLSEGPVAEELSARELAILRAAPPALVVISKPFISDRVKGNRVLEWIGENYEERGGDSPASAFILLHRK